MRFISLFSGMGGFECGLEAAGMKCVAQVEIDKHAMRVLAHHWPKVLRHEDVTKFKASRGSADLVCGGFPCQDLSVAGKRAGLAGKRSGLWHEFRRVIAEVAPRWVLIENVPGLLSSNGGRDMGTVLGGLAELGYGWAYRVLDLQYFGVPQRRERVFIVGCLGDAARAAAVLFEPESCDGDYPPSREAGAGVARAIAPCIRSSGQGTQRVGDSRGQDPLIYSELGEGHQTYQEATQAAPIRTATGGGGTKANLLTACASDYEAGEYEETEVARLVTTSADRTRAAPLVFGGGNTSGPRAAAAAAVNAGWQNRQDFGTENFVVSDTSPCLRSNVYNNSDATMESQMLVGTLQSHTQKHGHAMTTQQAAESGQLVAGGGVRRLTPLECLRLQSFPDDHLDLSDPPLSDSAKYRMIGNAVAPIVVEWIGRRIMEHEQTEVR